jgi:hypothetical protein
MTYFRVEIYDGCSLTLSRRRFENRAEAEEYRKTIRATDTRIVDVDENGAALPFRQN